MKPTKKMTNAEMDDGDSAHWVKSKRGRKKVTGKIYDGAGASGRTQKYLGKRKGTRKRVAGK
jgi:hypothetical protein